MADKTVVLLAACAGHGKDTAAEILTEICGREQCMHVAYADPLKIAVEHMIGVPRNIGHLAKDTIKFYGRTAREWWQYIGTEIGRNQIDENVWVDRMADRIRNSTARFVFVSDARFKNELSGLRDRLILDRAADAIQMITIRIINPRVQVNLSHQSESELHHIPLDAFDVVVMNDGSLMDLRTRLRSFARDYLGLNVDGCIDH